MKLVFMGTPNFAAASLQRLYDDNRDVACVFTKPDKPQNRGMKLAISPVKALALQYGTPVYQPETLRDGEAESFLRELKPDILVAVAYGKILPKSLLALPPLGCVNIHGSILPKYRGSAPIQWAVLNGEAETGVTSMYMAPEMDAGDIIMTKKTPIGEDETSGELFDRLAGLGAALLGETLDAIEAGTAARQPQDDSAATCAPPIKKDQCPIDWTKSRREILCQIRGLNPWPLSTAEFGGKIFKIFKAVSKESESVPAPGTIVSADADGIAVAAGDGVVVIKELQAPGGKRMAAADYLRGHPLCR